MPWACAAPSWDTSSPAAIWTACTSGSNPFTPVTGTYNGLFYEASVVHQNSSGSFTITVTSGGKFSGKLQIGGARYSMSGQFDVTGHANAPVPRPNMNPLSVVMQLDLTNSTDRIAGTVSDGTWVADLSGDRAVFDGKTSIAPQQGQYTMMIPPSGHVATEPSGFGCGTVSVDKAGRVRLNGNLGDGTKITPQTTVARNGRWPIYISIYGGQGSILGWMTFTNGAWEDLNGEMNWFKPASPGAQFYPAGFTLMTAASGNLYTPPPAGSRVLNFTNGMVVIDGGNLGQSITNVVTLNPNNQIISSNKTSVSIVLSTGWFKGAVETSATTRQTISGVLMQKRNAGWGYFLGTNQSGRALLGP